MRKLGNASDEIERKEPVSCLGFIAAATEVQLHRYICACIKHY